RAGRLAAWFDGGELAPAGDAGGVLASPGVAHPLVRPELDHIAAARTASGFEIVAVSVRPDIDGLTDFAAFRDRAAQQPRQADRLLILRGELAVSGLAQHLEAAGPTPLALILGDPVAVFAPAADLYRRPCRSLADTCGRVDGA